MTYSQAIQRYTTTFEYEIRNAISYKMDAVMMVASAIAYPLSLVILWAAVYSFGGYSQVSGFTLNDLIAYLFIISALNTLVWSSEISWMMQWDIKNGDIGMYMTRPVSYVKGMLVDSLAETIFFFSLAGIPLIIIVVVLTGIHVTGYMVALFAVAVVLVFLIGSLISTILGTLAAFITDTTGILSAYGWAASLVGGGILPLSMFPNSVSSILEMLPFQFLFYVPDGILTGNINLATIWSTFALGAFWTVMLALVAALMWRAAKRHLDAVGV
jgi:ABC-2 type transport system permease protein